MPARTLGAAAIVAALVLLPTGAHADEPERHATTVMADAIPATTSPADPTSTGIPVDSLVVLGLVALVGGALVLVLTGRRPDDDEPTD